MINVIEAIIQSIIKNYQNFTNAQKAAAFATLTAATALTYQAVKPSVDTKSVANIPELEEVYTQEDALEIKRNIATSDTDSEEQCKANNLPSFINMSIGWRGSLVEEGLKHIAPPSILVVAAGNNYPEPVSEEVVQLSKNLNAIVVGNLSPDGKRGGDSSSEHEEVHIMAPSDHYLSTADNDGSYQRFSGTSGATPLVTGSLAAFEWLSGYHPTAAEAKLLLEQTAIPTLSSNESPQKNGVGMVNAYKLGMVGKKLKELCGNDVSCFKRNIQDPSIYEFPEDSDVLQAVDQAFPECSADNCSDNFNICVDKATAIKRLRKAAFLNPHIKELWKYLACIYKSSGFTKDAKGAMSFYKALFGPDRNNVPTYSFCSVNSDCTLIPSSCSASDNNLSAVTQADAEIYYVERCEQARLCNNKCRCDSSEDIPISTPGLSNYYTSGCVNSRCVSTKETRTSPQSNDPGSHTE